MIWTLTVEARGFGLVTTIHETEGKAKQELVEDYDVEMFPGGRLAEPGSVGCPEAVEDYSIDEHQVDWVRRK